MSDSDQGEKKAGVPSWQPKSKDEAAKVEDKLDEKSAPESTASEPTRATLLEQARKFLQEDEVRDATTDKKIAFLESKGVRSEEIQELLGVTRNPEASAPFTVSILLPSLTASN